MSNMYVLQESTLQGLGNAMRKHFDTTDTFTPLEMIEKLNIKETGSVNIQMNNNSHINPVTGKWERPETWPDIDALAAECNGEEDCLYLTYDLTVHPDYHWIGIYVNMSEGDTWYLDRYDEGEFTHTHLSASKNNRIRYDLTNEPDNSTVQVWRLTSNGHISWFGYVPNSTVEAENFANNSQPCVDRAGILPWCVQLGPASGLSYTSPSSYIGATLWLEHDALTFGTKASVTSLRNFWYDARRLAVIDTSNWNTSGWAVTSLNNTWVHCYSLIDLELNNLDTSHWEVNNMVSAWNECFSLRQLDLSKWDTSKWSVANLGSTWYRCYSLQELDISTWDTSNWAVTTIQDCWQQCESLEKLDLNNWDTSNWRVSSLQNTWGYCYSLKKLNIDDWDVSNWPITSLQQAWTNCRSLKQLNLNKWDTQNWELTSLSNTWDGCNGLEQLNINEWDTSNWSLTTLSSTWRYCYSLQKLNLNDWDTNNWILTSLYYTWDSCYSLQELNINAWDTQNWEIHDMRHIISNCYNLKIFDIEDWDTTNWSNINFQGVFDGTWTLQICRLPLGLPVTSNFSYPNNIALIYYSGYGINANHNLSSTKLTADSIRSIFNRLPTISNSLTITLGAENLLKVTAEDIAVATNKGWTVA